MAKKKKKKNPVKVAKRDLPEDPLPVKKESSTFYIIMAIVAVTALFGIKYGFSNESHQPTSSMVHQERSEESILKVIPPGEAIFDYDTNLPDSVKEGLKEFPDSWKNFFIKYSDVDLIAELEECKTLEEAVIVLTCHVNPGYKSETLTSWLDQCETDMRSFTWRGEKYHDMSKENRMAALGSYLVRDKGFKYSDDITADMYDIAKVIEKHEGYCATLPVIFTLVARRLEQPVHLVTTVQHVFCRLDDGETKINIESTSPRAMGVGTPDSFYTDLAKEHSSSVVELNQNIIENTSTMSSLNLRQSLSVLLLNAAAAQSDPKKKTSIGFRKIPSDKIERHAALKYTAAAVYFDPRCVLPNINLIQNIRKYPEDFSQEFAAGARAHAIRRGILLPSKQDLKYLAKEVSKFKALYEEFKMDLGVFNATRKRYQMKKKPIDGHIYHLADNLKHLCKQTSTNLHKFVKANSLLLTEDVEKELTTIKTNMINVAKRVNEIL